MHAAPLEAHPGLSVMIELGWAALGVCLGLALCSLAAASLAAIERMRRLAVSAENALLCSFGAALVALAVLLMALIRRLSARVREAARQPDLARRRSVRLRLIVAIWLDAREQRRLGTRYAIRAAPGASIPAVSP